jgi:hypothetical protein
MTEAQKQKYIITGETWSMLRRIQTYLK